MLDTPGPAERTYNARPHPVVDWGHHFPIPHSGDGNGVERCTHFAPN